MASKLLEKVIAAAAGENMLTLHGMVGGEARLLGAVIKHAIYDWLTYRNSRDARKRRRAELARRWIFFKGEDQGTFDLYCNLIEASPQKIRDMITGKLASHPNLSPENVLEITSSIGG